jgi:fibronectin type 3 domain-containing protein
VDLSWDASSSTGITGYNLYRGSKTGGPYSKINSVLDAATAYTDNSVTAGLTYYYVTTALDTAGMESSYSNEVPATIPTP